MKIYLYTNTNIINFSLPDIVSGSFSFNEDPDEENKLINVEAHEGRWVLYSTEEVFLKLNDKTVDRVYLEDNHFYTIVRDSIEYLIYASETRKNVVHMFSYGKDVNLVIGNSEDATIRFNCPYLKNNSISINFTNDVLVMQKPVDSKVYVNDLLANSSSVNLRNGDRIYIYGLKIMILSSAAVVCYPSNSVNILKTSKLLLIETQNMAPPEEVAIKDVGLYDNIPFFSKSPQIRRTVERKSFQLSNPPAVKNEQSSLLMTVLPTLAFSLTSVIMVVSTVNSIRTGQTQMKDAWVNLLTSGLMVVTSVVWPLISGVIQNYRAKKNQKMVIDKYNEYLKSKETELIEAVKNQKEIMLENLLSINQCIDIIKTKRFPFWNKRSDQKDFLNVRIGIGNVPLEMEIASPEQGFKLEENFFEKMVDDLRNKYRNIPDMPISYSLYDNRITAVMGQRNKCTQFVHNLILQLVSFYSYEDLRLVVFTDEVKESNWDYLKYLNHNFNNDRSFRYFSSTADTAKNVLSNLNTILHSRLGQDREKVSFKPYYVIIIDNYDRVKRYDFIRDLTELNANYGFSILFIENRLSNLPSKCNNFITIGEKTSGILMDAYEKQQQYQFADEIKYDINMMEVARTIANIPIEFEKGVVDKLPDSLSFLELEKVGKVEQLNILNRWTKNDSVSSLKAEIGVNGQGDIIYLDLHEKFHGPHGLIAGTTGSGKSEFIITYILSMAINYSPYDVSFILIDYKGGGLAFAFENKLTKKILPHLSGTITNLDKAEMDRTLVSIDSELQRRQKMFNSARDMLGESTMDIYKYQRLFKEGKIADPISHLFIICDEFAELKTNQPDFMESLISTARIGRSLGVHLILATQKPSGVVNDQIWSNTKFRVCLKVQDESDSREMLKRPEAASIKEAGRFYLQVGSDEYFVLGQSAWCGAKYYPSDKIVKTVDRNVDVINDCGEIIKSMQYAVDRKVQAKGEQIASIMDNLIEVAKTSNMMARKLWLDNIPAIILLSDIESKYNCTINKFNVEAIVGEYDAPEKQEQGIVKYNYISDGNLLIYGNDSAEREMLLKTMIYSSTKNHFPDEINFYLIDYGSESLKGFELLPHFGGSVYLGEDEKMANLIKMITLETKKRKEILSAYGGDYTNYIKNSKKVELPIMTIIFNNFDSIFENNQDFYDILPEITRDSERYGIIFWFTCNGTNSVNGRIAGNFKTIYAFKLKDASDYGALFNIRGMRVPRDIIGRGILELKGVHEFQTASIVEDASTLNDYIMEYSKNYNILDDVKATKIPTLPKQVTLNLIEKNISSLTKVPIGIIKNSLDICFYDFLQNQGNIITANRLEAMLNFTNSLLTIFRMVPNNSIITLDGTGTLKLDEKLYPNYCVDEFDDSINGVIGFINELKNSEEELSLTVVVYGIDKIISSLSDISVLDSLVDEVKAFPRASVILFDSVNKLKNYTYEDWFNKIFSLSDGIWIGKGMGDQGLFRTSTMDRAMSENYPNDMGFVVNEGYTSLVKYIDFDPKGGSNE